MNYREIAEEYYHESLFFESLNEFLEFKGYTVDLKILERHCLAVYEENNKKCIIDRIWREFRDKEVCQLHNGNGFCIIHKCSKKEGLFQCSFFDEYGATGDFVKESIMQVAYYLVENYRGYDFI